MTGREEGETKNNWCDSDSNINKHDPFELSGSDERVDFDSWQTPTQTNTKTQHATQLTQFFTVSEEISYLFASAHDRAKAKAKAQAKAQAQARTLLYSTVLYKV